MDRVVYSSGTAVYVAAHHADDRRREGRRKLGFTYFPIAPRPRMVHQGQRTTGPTATPYCTYALSSTRRGEEAGASPVWLAV